MAPPIPPLPPVLPPKPSWPVGVGLGASLIVSLIAIVGTCLTILIYLVALFILLREIMRK